MSAYERQNRLSGGVLYGEVRRTHFVRRLFEALVQLSDSFQFPPHVDHDFFENLRRHHRNDGMSLTRKVR